MDTSLAWLYEHEDKFRRRTGQPLWSLSDWHNDPGDVALPTKMLAELRVDSESMTRYRFLDSVGETKQKIGSFYSNHYSTALKADDFALCQNGTSALHLLIRSLAEESVRRVLVVTPAYFSLFNVLNLYGLTAIYAHFDLLHGLPFDVNRILGVARDQMVDAIFLTNPIFSTGTPLSLDSVTTLALHAENTGKWLILDETLAGLPWHSDLQCPFVTATMQELMKYSRCIYLWSVSKSLFLNGLKHALVFAPPRIILKGLQGIEWVVLRGHSGGSMQVRTLRRRYSSSRSP